MIDTTVASGNAIPDGLYFVQPEGACWQVYRFRDGRVVGMSDEAMADRHDEARDSWAGIRPSEADELLDETDEQLSIDIAIAVGYDDAYGVSVSRPAN